MDPLFHWRSTDYAGYAHALEKYYHSREVTLCDKSDFPYYKELFIKERIRSLWEQILSFKRSSHLKRDAIEEKHCLIQ